MKRQCENHHKDYKPTVHSTNKERKPAIENINMIVNFIPGHKEYKYDYNLVGSTEEN